MVLFDSLGNDSQCEDQINTKLFNVDIWRKGQGRQASRSYDIPSLRPSTFVSIQSFGCIKQLCLPYSKKNRSRMKGVERDVYICLFPFQHRGNVLDNCPDTKLYEFPTHSSPSSPVNCLCQEEIVFLGSFSRIMPPFWFFVNRRPLW